MFDYRSELERRIEQFGRHLTVMHDRAHEEAHGPCFIIFDERRPAGGPGDEDLSEKKKLVLQLAGQGSPDGIPSDQADTFDLPGEGWRPDDSQNRYIQFSFERNWFCLDMPLETLYRPEAEEILRNRQGFFYLQNRRQFTLYGEDVDGHDPFRKVYLYSDEGSAAEDMAFVFFQVWKFPIDSRFYVTAASFNGKCEWERGFPIE